MYRQFLDRRHHRVGAGAQDLRQLAAECKGDDLDLSAAPWLSGFIVGALTHWEEIFAEAAQRAA
jgi:hypothetical protein